MEMRPVLTFYPIGDSAFTLYKDQTTKAGILVGSDYSPWRLGNHSVWGGNPYRWTDFHSGHST
ncbi:hypothetical protein GCM10020370_11420 [Paenibacillus hodogayensis]